MEEEERPIPLLRTAGIFYGAAALFAALWAALFRIPLFGPATPAPGALLEGAALGGAIVLLSRAAHRWLPPARAAAEEFRRLLGPIRPPAAVCLGLLSGFAEELLFRGALFPQLGLLASSLLFAACHYLPVPRLRHYPFFALAAGLLFGLLRQRSGSMVPPFLAHAVVNGFNLAWLGRMR